MKRTVGEIMSPIGATVGADATLRQAARRMSEYKTGAALVMDAALPGPGIVTERDILRALAEGADPDEALVGDYMHSKLVVADPSWSLSAAAKEMTRFHIRHIVVFDGPELVGIMSMRDVIAELGLREESAEASVSG
jgi:CBS domain-containing protein